MPAFVLIDDHRLVLDGYKSQLSNHYAEATFPYVGDSLDLAAEALGEQGVDCVILDLDLGDGSTALGNLERLAHYKCPIIIVSAMIDRGLVTRGLSAGAIGFVSKQAPFDELTQAIDAAIRREQYMSPDIAQAIVASPSVVISDQERTAVTLYASGLKMASVARRMGVSESTVNEYIKRVRTKFARAGQPAPTKVHLYQVARDEGWLE
jgi:DNA-binding NarL/FixJ family response regulator